ncbi:DUF4012 domain-containing protein [Diaminobutyricimonas sp. LJ205]|uniref:DUF4012 domain-containing protein n=1 Tax=Diaminobutyricimonas sp. LJ205 TaxID=2683590 RepID=UPI0012F49E1D|nr:DUF4012 domain-containing protein [Diaminobutyricimonas sp. LJ205]
MGAALLILAGTAAWIGIRGLEAKSELEKAKALVADAPSLVAAGEVPAGLAKLRSATEHAERASALTSDFIWRAAEVVPVAGGNLSAVRELAAVADSVLSVASEQLDSLAPVLSPAALKPVDGAIDLALLEEAGDAIKALVAAFDDARFRVDSINTDGLVDQVGVAVDSLDSLLTTYQPALQAGSELMAVVPGALGAEGPRDYLLVFQHNGEVMPRGGTIGSLVQVHVDQGRIELAQQASPVDFPRRSEPIIPIADDVRAIWPHGLGRTMQNLTETPRFSTSFEIAKSMWSERFGTEIDGLIALDPIALSYILEAVGPIPAPDGSLITSDNLVQSLMSDVYVKYSDPLEQDAYYQNLSEETFNRIVAGEFDPAVLIEQLVRSAEERRMLAWSGNTDEQALLLRSPFLGEPAPSTSEQDGIGVYWRDYTPSKLGFFMNQSVQIEQAQCDQQRRVRVTVKLTNTLPVGAVRSLPPYVTGGGGTTREGTIDIATVVYAPTGYTVDRIAVDGRDLGTKAGTDGEFVVGESRTEIAPERAGTFTFWFSTNQVETTTIETDISPVVNPTEVTVSTVDCADLQ